MKNSLEFDPVAGTVTSAYNRLREYAGSSYPFHKGLDEISQALYQHHYAAAVAASRAGAILQPDWAAFGGWLHTRFPLAGTWAFLRECIDSSQSLNQAAPLSLAELGLSAGVQDRLLSALKAGRSLFILGLSDSGKIDLVRSLLIRKSDWKPQQYKACAIGEFPEIGFPQKVRQFVTESGSGSPFSKVLSEVMSLEPDILLMGELRSPHQVTAIKGAIQNNTQVLIEAHASSCQGIVLRLSNLGLRGKDLVDVISRSASIYVSRLPHLCPRCSRPATPEESVAASAWYEKVVDIAGAAAGVLPLWSQLKSGLRERSESGCDYCCVKSGIRGYDKMVMICETWVPDEVQVKMLSSDSMLEKLFKHREEARINRRAECMTSLDDALSRIIGGEVSWRSVANRIGYGY